MNWRWKARIQRTFAKLPFLQEPAYYLVQRTFGARRRTLDPFFMLQGCAELVAYLQAAGKSVEGARVMEVGTGRAMDMPIGFFLCGAASVVTFDLHRYLKPGMVMASIRAMCGDEDRVLKTFSPVTSQNRLRERLDSLCSAPNCAELMRRAHIEYRAPADAAHTGLPDHSIDVQMSYTVLEHIPPITLHAILVEANRILAPDGLTLHHIDPSDHFSHDDPSILPINFLQYSDAEWNRIAANQWAYHNRLRAAEFAALYEECGHQILLWKPHVDVASRHALENGFPLHPQFGKYPPEVLSTVVLQVLSRPSKTI
jgi:SAM-dependent methyltransferase